MSIDPSAGTLSGTPPSNGNVPLSVQVTDSGSPPQTATAVFNVTILQKLQIFTQFVQPGNRGVPYAGVINAVGGANAATLTLAAGNLPPGLGLDASGNIRGTPTQAGTFQFSVQANDPGPPAQTATADLSLTIEAILKIINSPTSDDVIGRNYSSAVQIVNGTGPFQWVAQGLPQGLSMNAASGLISGVPTEEGFSIVEISVSDHSNPVQSDAITAFITVYGILQFTQTPLANANIGQFSFLSLPFTGGEPPLTFNIASGAIPPGMFLNGEAVAGIPNQLGDFTFTVAAQDSATPPQTAQSAFTIHVLPLPPAVTTAQLPRGIIAHAYSGSLAAQNGTPPYTWSISSGTLPDGLVLDSQGEISGTPTAAGTFPFTILVTDSGVVAQTGTRGLSIQILAHALGRNDTIATATPISNGTTVASISPFSDPSSPAPDSDYYVLTANPGALVSVSVLAKRISNFSPLDSVLEIVDASGTRFTTCKDPVQAFLRAPAVVDPNPNDFNNSCINDDDPNTGTTDSDLQFQVPGTSGPAVTFYLHVLDYRGDARPDMAYQLQVSGAN
jgi:hypothetical protein